MAQRVNVELIDDLDESPAAETVSFALDGVSYEIDLSEANAEGLRNALAPYLGHARRTGGRRGGSSRGSSASSSRSSAASGNAADIRAWARENGFEVSERGRVSAEVRSAYAAAH
ncbi:histone-like nucleoid-structuring protein Lsr2 [Nocardioides marmoribigeumensis]|jgi:hypothetical protein|uniref:Lsr2 family protein n=1 Tax=Nocardioides marmoribigeumensis TaxID=433649 RepID=A0ABU2BSY3_9ACTN|nr:Lsr2 family protein [Nocardioides marmoribigeumensis]MDR7361743.1 hypothetical protein [Nocardioides marmoribigeumensis]